MQTYLAKYISEASWGELIRQLKYKASWYGKHISKINRYYASTQSCSSCGHRHFMSLEQRTYMCPVCGMKMDRDHNAAINILHEGIRVHNNLGQVMPEANDDESSLAYACK